MMLLKAVGAVVALIVIAIGGFAVYINLTWDKDYSGFEKPAIKASTDPEVIKRGEYLAHSVAHCSICHAPEAVTMKRQPGERPAMVGGYKWDMGPMGTLHSRNITPDPETGIGKWTDEELAREEPSLARGKYLAHGPAACVGCHSPFNLLAFQLEGAPFSGSEQAEPDPKDPSMVYRMPNLTPDAETGHIAKWDEEQFVTRFRAGRTKASSKMPWEAYREMTDADLRAVFRYLKSLPPAKRYIGPPHRKADEDPAKDAPSKA